MTERKKDSASPISIQEHTDPKRPGGICPSPTGKPETDSNGFPVIICDMCHRRVLPEARLPNSSSGSRTS